MLYVPRSYKKPQAIRKSTKIGRTASPVFCPSFFQLADVVFTFINRSITYSFLVRITQTQVLLRALYTALGKVETKSWGLLPVGCLSLAQQTSGMSTLPTPGHQVQELGDLNLKVSEAYCPHAYSYAFDDNNSTFFCMNTNYHVLSQQNYYVSSVTLAFGFRKWWNRDSPPKYHTFFSDQIIKESHAIFKFYYPCFSIFSGLKITRGGFVVIL